MKLNYAAEGHSLSDLSLHVCSTSSHGKPAIVLHESVCIDPTHADLCFLATASSSCDGYRWSIVRFPAIIVRHHSTKTWCGACIAMWIIQVMIINTDHIDCFISKQIISLIDDAFFKDASFYCSLYFAVSWCLPARLDLLSFWWDLIELSYLEQKEYLTQTSCFSCLYLWCLLHLVGGSTSKGPNSTTLDTKWKCVSHCDTADKKNICYLTQWRIHDLCFRVHNTAEVEKWKESFSHVLNSESKCCIHFTQKRWALNWNKSDEAFNQSKLVRLDFPVVAITGIQSEKSPDLCTPL